jgi:hypothetical protein
MAEVVGAATLWGLFSAWLFLPHVGAPRRLRKTTAALLCLQLVALLAWGYTRGALPHAAAFEEIPVFSLAVIGAGVLYGLRIARRSAG